MAELIKCPKCGKEVKMKSDGSPDLRHKCIEKINLKFPRLKDKWNLLSENKKQILIFIGALVVLSIFFIIVPNFFQENLSKDFNPKKQHITKEFTEFQLNLEYDDKVSSETPLNLKFYSDKKKDINFNGKIADKVVSVSRSVDANGVYIKSLGNSQVNKTFSITACANEECQEFTGNFTVFSYDYFRSINLIIQVFSLFLLLLFAAIIYSMLKKLSAKEGNKFFWKVAIILIIALILSYLVEINFIKLISAGVFSILFIALIFLIFNAPEIKTPLFITILFTTWAILIFTEPIIAYISVSILALLYFLIKKDLKNRKAYITFTITIIGILFSSFIFQPIVQPIITNSTESEEVTLNYSTTNPIVLNYTEMTIKKPIIGMLPFGIDEIKVPVEKKIWLKLFLSTCSESIGEGETYLRIKLKTAGLSDCRIKINYTYESTYTNEDWKLYADTLLDKESFSGSQDSNNSKVNYSAWRLKYNGAFKVNNFAFNITQIGDSVVIVNEKPTNINYIDNQKYVMLDLHPNEEYLVVQLIGKDIIDEEANEALKKIGEKYS